MKGTFTVKCNQFYHLKSREACLGLNSNSQNGRKAAFSFAYFGLNHVLVQRNTSESPLVASKSESEDKRSISRDLSGTNLAVHVVFSFNQLSTVHLASVGLTGDDVALCFVQDLDGYTDGHVSMVLLKDSFT